MQVPLNEFLLLATRLNREADFRRRRLPQDRVDLDFLALGIIEIQRFG
jgi:hypothetical protein